MKLKSLSQSLGLKRIINQHYIMVCMKTKAKSALIVLIIASLLLISASAAFAGIPIPQSLLQKVHSQNPAISMPLADTMPSEAKYNDELALEKMYMKEDETKAEEIVPVKIINEPKINIFKVFIQKYLGSRIRIPPGSNPAYPIELSSEDRANPLFASVDISKYQRFQSANRDIFAAIVWVNRDNPSGRSIIYSQSTMQSLAHYIALLEAGQSFPLTAPPSGFDVPWGEHLDSTRRFYTENEALNMWLPHIALSLYVEVNHLVPWSIIGYSDYQKSLLLDSRHFINYWALPSGPAYTFFLNWENGGGLTGITDWNPFYSYNFLEDNSMIQPTQQETIHALTQWIRENIYHEAASNAYALHLAYGYNGSYPVDKVLNPPWGQKHWTQGCTGTSSLYSAMLRTINIPVSINLTLGGHRAPLFLTANLALIHGDDPYSIMNRRGLQEVPVEDVFVTIDEFYATNHAEPERYNGYMPNEAEMAGYLHTKRTAQNAYDSMAYSLLKKRGEDVIMYLPNGFYNSTLGYWWLNESWRPIFEPSEVPVMLANLDNEITSIGDGDYNLGNLRICRGLIPRSEWC